MKLHLPKALFTAVMAVFAVSQTVWAGTWDGDCYTFMGEGDDTAIDGTAEGHTGTNGMFLRAGAEGVTATVTQITQKADAALTISGTWNSTTNNFELLTVDSLVIGDGTGSATLNVGNSLSNEAATTDSNVIIKSISGTISTLNVGAAGNLTIGDATDTTETAYTLKAVNVSSGGKLTLAGGTTTLGNGDQSVQAAGEIVVSAGAVVKFAAKDNTHWNNKTNISLLGGEWDTNGTRQSFAGGSVIKLADGSITDKNGTFGDAYGAVDIISASIESSGTSSIAGGLRVRNNNVVIDVKNDTLTIDRIVNHKDLTGAIVKRGDGTLVLTSLAKGNWYGQVQEYFAGNTVLEGGAIEYAINKVSDDSTSDGEYSGAVSGSGNIVKSGTGAITLANISNLDGSISVTGGTLNVTSLTANKTMKVSVTGTDSALSIDSVAVNVNNWTPSFSSAKYYVYETQGEGDAQQTVAVETTGNGFYADASTYLLFEGYEWDGSVAGYSTTQENGNTYLTAAGDVSSVWYVRASDFSVDGSESNAAKTATGYHVESGMTLTIAGDQNDTMTAAKILSETTGAGNIKLTTNAQMVGAAQVEGKLTVEGATLTVNLGNNTTGRDTDHSYLTSFDSIDLNNATIQYHGSNTTMNNVTVGADGATLRIKDMGADRVITLGETTTLNGDFTIESRGWEGSPDGLKSWKSAVNIEALTGAGGLIVKGNNSSQGETNKVTVGLLDTYTGTITVDRPTSGTTSLIATAAGDINLSGLNVSGGANVDLTGVSGTKNLGAVSVGANTTLNLQGTIGDMVATGDGSISLAAGTAFTGTASIANATTLASTITNSGSLTLSGALSASSIEVFDSAVDAPVSYGNGDVEGNGYLNAAYVVVKSAGDSSQLSANGLTLTAAGASYALSQVENELHLILSGTSGVYVVSNTQDYTADSIIASAATTGITMNGGTLNLNTALADGIAINTAKAGSVINVADDVTLSNSSVAAGNIKSTLAGGSAAVYDMGTVNVANGDMPAVTVGSEWKGTVKFASGTTLADQYLDLNNYGVAGSTIQFDGVTGYFGANRPTEQGESAATFDANIKLTGNGLNLNNGYGGSEYTFNGDFSGEGKMEFSRALNKNGKGLSMTYAGDMSKWTGELLHSNGNDTNEYIYAAAEGKSTTIANAFKATSGTMKVKVDNASAVSMTGDITAEGGIINLTKTGGSKLSVTNMNAKTSNIVLTGTGDNAIEVTNLSIAAGKTVTGAADVTVTNLTLGGTDAINLTGALTVADGATINLTGLQINADQTTYTLATAANGVSLQDYTLTGLDLSGTAFADYTATIAVVNPNAAAGVMTLAEGTTTNTALVLTLTAPEQPGEPDPGATTLTQFNIVSGKYENNVLTFMTDADLTNKAFGDKLNAIMSDEVWAQVEIVGATTLPEEVLVSFTDAAGELIDFDNGSTIPTITINGEGTKGSQVLTGEGTIVGNYVTAYIPEPTTTTLSLLALAGLAVRRRRK